MSIDQPVERAPEDITDANPDPDQEDIGTSVEHLEGWSIPEDLDFGDLDDLVAAAPDQEEPS